MDAKFDNIEFSVSGQFPELTHGCSSWILLMAFPKECGWVGNSGPTVGTLSGQMCICIITSRTLLFGRPAKVPKLFS